MIDDKVCLTESPCTKVTTQKNIVVRENRSSFIINNTKQRKVYKVEVDGCLIDDGRERCDWLFKFENNVLFVELKGSDIDKAIKQLTSTISITKKRFIDCNKCCYIVTTRVPKFGPSVQKRAIAFKKNNNASLFVKNLRAKVSI